MSAAASALARPETRPLRVTALAEIMRAHIAVSAVAFGLGFVLTLLSLRHLTPELGALLQGDGGVLISSGRDELLFILRTNLLFFLMVSLLPVINVLLVLPQFFLLGATTAAMAALPFVTQFDLLYRHASLEAVCLLTSVAVSHRLLDALRRFADGDRRDLRALRADLGRLAPLLLFILGLTVVAALLEGHAVVAV